MYKLSFNVVEDNIIHFEEFAVLFYSTMLRAAFINLKSYIDRKEAVTPLELRLLEYKRNIYLKAISNSPGEVKILKALIDHRSKYKFTLIFIYSNMPSIDTYINKANPQRDLPTDNLKEINWEEIENKYISSLTSILVFDSR